MTEATDESAPAGNKPVDKIQIGSVHASIWRNTTEKGDFHAATFERRYQDKDGKWQSSHSFGPSDLLALEKAADKAHDAILAMLPPKK